MKKIICFILCLSLVLCISGCTTEKGPKEITVLTWENYLPQTAIDSFTEATGIAVHSVSAETNEEMLQMLTEAPDAYDMVIASDYIIAKMVEQNLLQEIKTDEIANYRYVNDMYMSKYYDPENKYSVPYSSAGILMAYDPAKIPFEISSYTQLLLPELQSSTVFLDDYSAIFGIANLMLENEPDAFENKNDIQNILSGLANSIKVADSDAPELEFKNSEASVGVMFTSQLGYAIEENPSLRVVYPKEGFLYSIDSIVIPAKADGAAYAAQLINYIHDPMNNGKIMQEICCSSTNTSGQQFMDDTYRSNDGYNLDPKEIKNGHLLKPFHDETDKFAKNSHKAYFKNRAPGKQENTEAQ